MNKRLPLIIADTYKVIDLIGSGSGGIIYLAEHLRLNKNVVLKADRRTLSTKPEILRREVDALKNLSHTYIPHVYDFIVEEGIIYTVMDYIEGESFDKSLKRGERFPQVKIVEWACQLLEAISYLHSRPPHGILHADIKPANIMLTPQGDVRLIDFNIALALGEEGAISVGRSFGYASPEHYGFDYSTGSTTIDGITNFSSDTFSNVETILDLNQESNSSEKLLSKKTIMLDVRSDIYSLGAALYHILTGERPVKNLNDIKPISSKRYNPEIINIIEKAMNLNPDLRYQSAEEMLLAFNSLRINDPRSKRYKRNFVLTWSLIISLLFIGGFTTFVGLKQMEQLQNAYVLSEYSDNALRDGDVVSALTYALQALPDKPNIFTPPNTAEAKKALTNALNVYDLSDGFKIHRTVKLPSSPLNIQLSPNGKTATIIYAYNVVIIDTESAKIIVTLPVENSALSEAKYIDDNNIAYAGKEGLKVYDIVKNKELWSGEPATSIAVSADSNTLATVYKDEDIATVYDSKSGDVICNVNFEGKYQSVTVNDSFANPNDNLFAINQDGTMLGVSFADGSLWVYDLKNGERDLELFDSTSGYTYFEGGFFEQYFAFSAANSVSSVFAIIDTIEMIQTGGFESTHPFSVQADEGGIYVQTENILVNIHPVTGDQKSLVTNYEDITQFAYSGSHTILSTDKGYIFFDKSANLIDSFEKEYNINFLQIAGEIAIVGSTDTPDVQILKLESHCDAEVYSYNPLIYHDEARVSMDYKTVMLFSYERFYLYDINGDLITEVTIPDAEYIYDQQYIRDEKNSYLEVIYNDGKICGYSAKDGYLLYERNGQKPDLSLYEEFLTDTLRIESPLHGTPIAYDRNSGKLVRELESDAYLTYVTQVGEYVIAEYVTTEKYMYGVLLNDKCEELAYLPYLCDIIDDELIFDYPIGSLRKSHIYHIDELIELAREQIIK